MQEVPGIGIDFDDRPEPLATVTFTSPIGEMSAHFGLGRKSGDMELWFGWIEGEADGQPIRTRLEAFGDTVDGRVVRRPSGCVDFQWMGSKLHGPYAWGTLDLTSSHVAVWNSGDRVESRVWERRFSTILQRLAADPGLLDRAGAALDEVRVAGWRAVADDKRAKAAILIEEAERIEVEELGASVAPVL